MNVPHRRSRLLALFLQQFARKTWSVDARNAVVSAVCLVQMGLDVHEAIAEDGQEHDRHIRVLIGDYLSAHYYLLLSGGNFVDAMDVLARAICRVNEQKMHDFERVQQGNVPVQTRQEWRIECDLILYTAWAEWFIPSVRDTYEQLLRAVVTDELEGDSLGQATQRVIDRCDPELRSRLYALRLTTVHEEFA